MKDAPLATSMALSAPTVPVVALLTAQFLFLAVPVLTATVLQGCPRTSGSLVLTWIAITCFVVSLTIRTCWPRQSWKTSTTRLPVPLSSMSLGCLYLCNTFLYVSFYLLLSEASWNMFVLDQPLIAGLIVTFAAYSYVTDFPTPLRASHWSAGRLR